MTPDEFVLVTLIAGLLTVLILPFVLAPVRMRSRSSQLACPVYTPEETPLSPAVTKIAAAVRELGFKELGTWRQTVSSLGTGWVTLLEHPRTLDAAKVVRVVVLGRTAITLAFQSRFDDGSELITANNRVPTGYPRPPGLTAAWLPDLLDSKELYAVHNQLRDAVGGVRQRIGIGPDVTGYLRSSAERIHANWVATGYYTLDNSPGMIRPTWKGAILLTWRLVWPLKHLFRARRRGATRRLLAEHGVSVDDPGRGA
jgi:hypothetical protein